eukprot:IDg3207t1
MTSWIDDSLEGEALYDAFLESMPPAVLFHEDCLRSPILYQKLRDLLLRRGVEVRRQRGLYIVIALAELYPSDVDKATALALISPSRKKLDRVPARSRTASSVKYSGTISEAWSDYAQAYVRYLQDCEMSHEDGAKFLHSVLCGELLRFYTYHPFSDLRSAIDAIEAEFNSRTRQNQVKNELAALRLPFIMRSKSVSASEGLEHIRSEISAKIYLCPKEYRTEAHKHQYLRDAVLGLEWSRDALSRAESGNWTFQTLFCELYASIGAHEEGILAVQKDKAQSVPNTIRRSSVSSSIPGTSKAKPSILFTVLIISSRNAISQLEHRLQYVGLSEKFGFIGGESDSEKDAESLSETSSSEGDDERHINFVNFNKIANKIEGTSEVEYSTSELPRLSKFFYSNLFCISSRLKLDRNYRIPAMRKKKRLFDYYCNQKNSLHSIDEMFHTFKSKRKNYSASSFQGCCVDTGAQSSVIGVKQRRQLSTHRHQYGADERFKSL